MQLCQLRQRTFDNPHRNMLPLVRHRAGKKGAARLRERNVVGELNTCRQLGLKPNFSDIGRRHGIHRHTVARYWSEGGDVEDGRCNRASGFDPYGDLIAERAALPGATRKAVHEYILHRCGDGLPMSLT